MKLSPQDKKVLMLKDFKQAMGVQLSSEEATEIWGDNLSPNVIAHLDQAEKSSGVVEKKVLFARRFVNTLPKFGLVRYIGISGSVGSGFADEKDDIDLFIVVRDHSVWLYRFLVKVFGGKNTVWYGQKDQRDKICLNFFCEERGLSFENHDIFTLNEIYSLISIYNVGYWDYLLYMNPWLHDEYLTLKAPEGARNNRASKITLLLLPIELVMFLLQAVYMLLFRHQPNLGRLWRGFIKGRIEFYPDDFRVEKMRNFRKD